MNERSQWEARIWSDKLSSGDSEPVPEQASKRRDTIFLLFLFLASPGSWIPESRARFGNPKIPLYIFVLQNPYNFTTSYYTTDSLPELEYHPALTSRQRVSVHQTAPPLSSSSPCISAQYRCNPMFPGLTKQAAGQRVLPRTYRRTRMLTQVGPRRQTRPPSVAKQTKLLRRKTRKRGTHPERSGISCLFMPP